MVLCFTWGESSIFWPCAFLLQGNNVQGTATSKEGSKSSELGDTARAVRDGAASLVLRERAWLGGSLPSGETQLCLSKLLDFGTNSKAVHEEFPRLHTAVRLTVYDQQTLETHSAALPAVGYFLYLLVSPLAKARSSQGGATDLVREANTKEWAAPSEQGASYCFYSKTNIKRKNEMIIT